MRLILNGCPGNCPQWPVRLPPYTQCLPCGKHGTDPAPHAHAHRWQNENKSALYLSMKSILYLVCKFLVVVSGAVLRSRVLAGAFMAGDWIPTSQAAAIGRP